MFKLKKKAFNTNRNNFARRIKTARIIKKLIIALKLGLPIRGKIKDCKFRWTTLAKIAPKKINPKTTSEPIKPKKNPHKVQNTKMSKKITSKKFVSITFANVCRLLKTIKQVITFTNKIQVQNSNYRVFMKKSISATIITLDEEDTLQTCIQNVTQLCDEVIVLDSYSKDKTTDIAKKLGAKVFFQSFLGDGPQKKKSAELSSNDWILSIDADETLSESALEKINSLDLKDPTIGYALRRKNFCGEHWLKGIYPDYKVRLYHRKHSHYDDRKIHSFVHCPKKKKIKADIIHPTFKNYSHWIAKLNAFSSTEASYQYPLRKKKVTYATLITHSLCTFLKKFFIQRGFLKGKDGLISSITVSFHTFAKYVKMLEIQTKKKKKR